MPFEINVDKFPKDVILILMTELIGHYSIDGDLQYRDDLSQLKYYIPPENSDNVSLDLNIHISSVKPESIFIRLNGLLRWISNNFNLLEKPFSQKSQWLDFDFICHRNVLETIFCTPYRRWNNQIICASKYRGTIYLYAFPLKNLIKHHAKYVNMYDCAYKKKNRLPNYRLQFQQYMVADHPSHKPDISAPVNECEKFHCIFTAILGDHSLLYEAEIGGISSQQPITDTLIGKTFEIIQFKILKLYNEAPPITFTIEKASKWWSQNYLIGIEKMICGIKNLHEEVKMIKEYSTNNLPTICGCRINVDLCKKYCTLFLDTVKKIVMKDYNECMYKFSFDESMNVINFSEEDPNEETYLFLNPSFIVEAENYKTFP